MRKEAKQEIVLQTACGALRGVDTGRCAMYLGVPFARAERFAYAERVEHWDGEIDATRFGIIAVPIIIDLIGHIFMIFPYLFWDYDGEKHKYVMEVLKQRERLANEGYFPAEYDGGLTFMEAAEIKNSIPTNAKEMLDAREKVMQEDVETENTADVTS